MIDPNDVFPIGRIGKPHGVRGEVSFHFTDDSFDTIDADYLILSIDHILVPFFMEEYRFKNGETALVKFCDIDTQEKAAELTGCEVFLPRQLTEEGDGQLSWAQLVGFDIIDAGSGRSIGRIASIDDTTINLLFELEDGTLIPASADLIIDLNPNGRHITMQLPEGLIDENP